MNTPDFTAVDMPALLRAHARFRVAPYLAFAVERAMRDPTPPNLLIACIEFERFAFSNPRHYATLMQRHDEQKGSAA
jgi:hypothetical protein